MINDLMVWNIPSFLLHAIAAGAAFGLLWLAWLLRPVRPRKDWIQTYTGRAVRPLHLRPEDVDIRDIARHLSMLCRYAGAVHRFYSVAEHSVRVARRVWELTRDVQKTRKALIHDATEAYLVDVPAPVKRSWWMWGYRRAERRAAEAISLALGVLVDEPAEVKAADVEMLGTEARQLKAPVHPDWPVAAALPVGPLGWSPEDAEHVWLRTWTALLNDDGFDRLARVAAEWP